MSRYNRQGRRSAPGKSDCRIKHTDVDPWKPQIYGSLDGVSCSQHDKSSVTGDSVFEDVASYVNNLKLTLLSLDDDVDDDEVVVDDDDEHDDDDDGGGSIISSKMVKRFGDKSQNDDDNDPVFDICPKRVSSVIKPKALRHVMDQEKPNQSMTGQDIIILRPGMVLMKGYMSTDDQVGIVKTCRDLGIGDGGFYQPGYSGGSKLHLQMMCLGKNWDPDTNMYTELRRSDKTKPPGIPEKFHDMVKNAIQDSNEFIRMDSGSSDEEKGFPPMSPDICIVNFYTKCGRLGLHQDKNESEKSLKKGLPVVSFSIGDSADFLYGETRAVDEADKVVLESGDVLIFGGKSRLIYHGVTRIHPDTAPTSLREATDMRPGRLNLTFRMY